MHWECKYGHKNIAERDKTMSGWALAPCTCSFLFLCENLIFLGHFFHLFACRICHLILCPTTQTVDRLWTPVLDSRANSKKTIYSRLYLDSHNGCWTHTHTHVCQEKVVKEKGTAGRDHLFLSAAKPLLPANTDLTALQHYLLCQGVTHSKQDNFIKLKNGALRRTPFNLADAVEVRLFPAVVSPI